MEENKKREDLDSTKSSHTGIAGLFERSLRKFKNFMHLACITPIYLITAAVMGISLLPAVYLFAWVQGFTNGWPQMLHFASLGIAVAFGYFAYGFTLIFLVPLLNFILPTRIKPWRGIYYSLQTVPWYIHNALIYVVRYTFLEFITPTPFNHMFYRLMGMKMGRGVQINTTNISDAAMLELGDKVTIGGSATIVCHYGSGGFLVLAPVRIHKGATVGLRAIVMGDVEIGENARLLPNSVVMPKTRIPAGEIWGGVPAQHLPNYGKEAKEKE